MPFPDGIDLDRPSTLDRLRVAFAIHLARQMAEADEVIDEAEAEALWRYLPDRVLNAFGYLDERGQLTGRFQADLAEALRVLPQELGQALKLELLTIFHQTGTADGELHPREVAVLDRATALLGLSWDVLERHLSRRGDALPANQFADSVGDLSDDTTES
jgi:uncharacterized tellurite resistance protein B-like protein